MKTRTAPRRNIPFWLGEAPARTSELSAQVANIRETISDLTEEISPSVGRGVSSAASAAVNWLIEECGLDQAGAEQAVEYIIAGRAVLRAVPTQLTIIAERFFDESGGMQLVISRPVHGAHKQSLGASPRKRFCRSFNFELQAAATDNGLNISLSEHHSFPLADVFRFLHSASVGELLEQAVLASPIFTLRDGVGRQGALSFLLRFMGGKKVAPQIQRMRAPKICWPPGIPGSDCVPRKS